MSKLHKSTNTEGFRLIKEEDMAEYNNWRVNQYANQKSAKTFWGMMILVGIIGGAMLELAFPTKDAIFAIVGFVWMVISLVMMKFSTMNRD